ncbi:MAG: hypothetical protein ACRDJV_05650 [Actinomycetota bacterium]
MAPDSSERGEGPLQLSWENDPRPLTPPAAIEATVRWEIAEDCDVVDSVAYLEMRARRALWDGERPSFSDIRLAKTSEDFAPIDDAREHVVPLAIEGSRRRGEHGDVPMSFELPAAFPSVDDDYLTVCYGLVAVVVPAGSPAVTSRSDVRVLAVRSAGAAAESSPDFGFGSGLQGGLIVVDDVRRHARIGDALSGNVEVTPPPGAWTVEISLLRVHMGHALGGSTDAVVRKDHRLSTTGVIELSAKSEIVPFSFPVPADAQPTCLLPDGRLTYAVRVDIAPASKLQRLTKGGGLDLEVNLYHVDDMGEE